MNPNKFIEILEKSGNSLLESAAKDVADWSKLKHNKECLELFLRHNVAVVYSISGNITKSYLVSSNTAYLEYLNWRRVVKNKNSVVKLMASSSKYEKILKSRNPSIVRTWDLIENNRVEIPMGQMWMVKRWVGINKDNLNALAIATDEILTRGKLVRDDRRA